jgi:hypothetical protein
MFLYQEPVRLLASGVLDLLRNGVVAPKPKLFCSNWQKFFSRISIFHERPLSRLLEKRLLGFTRNDNQWHYFFKPAMNNM